MTADKNFTRLVRERARRTGESYATARSHVLRHRTEEPMEDLVEVSVANVRHSSDSDAIYVPLEDHAGGRTLMVGIGPAEATAIAFAPHGTPLKRPMTHDALKLAVDALGGHVRRIVVGFVPAEHTYTADVAIGLPDGGERHLDWRVSDAVALAVRCTPRPAILVPASLFASSPAPPPPDEPWPLRARVRCTCGQWARVMEYRVTEQDESGPRRVQATVMCAACSATRQAELVSPDPAGD
jgi:bifunctional DNase/RNase